MIGFLTGKIHRISHNTVVINVNGVGYETLVPSSLTLNLNLGQNIALEIYTHVNETSLQLFGFKTIKEKQIFQKLISVSGIGPKLGLTIISDLPLPQLFQAVTHGDVTALTKISGIGKKTAERIIVELKDKFKDETPLNQSQAANDNPLQSTKIQDVTHALISLGYPEYQAKKVVGGIEVAENDTVQSLIKKSLVYIQK